MTFSSQTQTFLDLGFLQHFYTFLPRYEKHLVPLYATPRPQGTVDRCRSICLGTSQRLQNYFSNGTRLPQQHAEQGVEEKDQPISSRFCLHLSGVPDVSILPILGQAQTMRGLICPFGPCPYPWLLQLEEHFTLCLSRWQLPAIISKFALPIDESKTFSPGYMLCSYCLRVFGI